MQYRVLKECEAGFLAQIFSTPEYDLYFAENDTTEEEWKERSTLFEIEHTYIISKDDTDIGWIMYRIDGAVCELDIIVLVPTERYKGYGKEIFSDLLIQNPEIKTIKLDVQQRNENAIKFYKKLGFQVVSEEYQPVNGEPVPYYNMVLMI